MTDQFDDDNNDENEESFAKMLDAYSPGSVAEVAIGDKIRGEIVSIGRDSVFIDTGTKIDGAVDKAELLDKNGQLALQEGDIVELYVVALSEEEIKVGGTSSEKQDLAVRIHLYFFREPFPVFNLQLFGCHASHQ